MESVAIDIVFVEIVVREGSIYFAAAVHGNTPACIKLCMSITLLKMDRYYSTTMCHYWDMSVK